jgi:ligand-binding SRPBCC domain-containing protein
MGPFPQSNTKHTHILVAEDYVTKWVEAISTKSVDYATKIKMLKEVIFGGSNFFAWCVTRV